jgi:hypothetical protein
MRVIHKLSLLTVALACLGCESSDLTGADAGLEITTDATNYVAELVPGSAPYAQYSFRVIVRTTNRSPSVVGLGRCWPSSRTPIYSVATHADSRDKLAAYNPIWACVGGHTPLMIWPGGTRVDTLFVRGPNSFDGVTGQGFGETTGLMSIHISGVFSNRFSVSVAQ